MKRYVYAFDTSDAAMSAVEYLGANGLDGQHVSLVARSDINKNELPDSLLNVSMDFTPSVKRGAVFGAATGLLIAIDRADDSGAGARADRRIRARRLHGRRRAARRLAGVDGRRVGAEQACSANSATRSKRVTRWS